MVDQNNPRDSPHSFWDVIVLVMVEAIKINVFEVVMIPPKKNKTTFLGKTVDYFHDHGHDWLMLIAIILILVLGQLYFK